MLTQARPAIVAGTRPIVIAPTLAKGYTALRAAGIDPDQARAYVAILTPVSAPLSQVLGARPELHPIINVLGDVEPGRFLKATIDYLERRGWEVRGADDDVEDKSTRGPRERPRPRPTPPAPAPAPASS